jgi:hypothetical protein
VAATITGLRIQVIRPSAAIRSTRHDPYTPAGANSYGCASLGHAGPFTARDEKPAYGIFVDAGGTQSYALPTGAPPPPRAPPGASTRKPACLARRKPSTVGASIGTPAAWFFLDIAGFSQKFARCVTSFTPRPV